MRPTLPIAALCLVLTACKRDALDTDTNTDTDTADADTEELDTDTADPGTDLDEPAEHVVTADFPRNFQWLSVNTADASIDPSVVWPDDGVASFRFTTGDGSGSAGSSWPLWQGNGGKAFLGTTLFNGQRIDAITELSYVTWVPDDETLLPYLNLFVDLNNDGRFSPAHDDIWAFDPAYSTSFAVGGDWQDWDALTGAHWRCLYGRSPVGDGVCGYFSTWTWDDLADASPGATVAAAACGEAPFPDAGDCTQPDLAAPGLLWVGGQKTGGTWANWTAHIDGILLAPGGTEEPFDLGG